jgi:uncharacterized protein HemY
MASGLPSFFGHGLIERPFGCRGVAAVNRVLAWVSLGVGVLVALAAAVLFTLTLSDGAFPGLSANLISRHAGLEPNLSPEAPIWSTVAGVLARVWPADCATALNLLSLLCGVACVWLLYDLVRRAIAAAIEVRDENRRQAFWAGILGGAGAALALAVSPPFWIAATRAQTETFHLLLLLIVARLLLACALSPSLILMAATAFLFGVGVVEFETFMLFAPLLALALLYLLWREEELTASRVLLLLGAGVLGLGFYFVAAFRFHGTEGAALMDVKGVFGTIWFIWRHQYHQLRGGLPQVGWLLVIVSGVVPWLTSLLVARRGLNEEKEWSYYILHVILAGVVLAVLFNAPFSPWRLTGFSLLLATPSLLNAVAFGYLVAYWFLLPYSWWPDAEWGWPRRVRLGLGPILAVAALGAIGAAGALNFRTCDARAAGPVNAYAREVVRCMGDRTWLLTDGLMDENYLIAAREIGKDIRVVSLRPHSSGVYRRRVEGLFQGNTRLQSMAELGLLPLVQEWFATDPAVVKDVAVMAVPDLWHAIGAVAVPHRTLFLGAPALDAVDLDAELRANQELWSKPGLGLGLESAKRGVLAFHADQVERHISFVANNFGVLLEDAGRGADAFAAYAAARRIYPQNLSALLNQQVMVSKGFQTPEAGAVGQALKEYPLSSSQRPLWALARYYGFVRVPEAFASLGWNWAMSGHPGLAVSGLKMAVALTGGKGEAARQNLAAVYVAQDMVAEGEALYTELLRTNPTNTVALLGLARVAARRGDFDRARSWMEQAEKAGLGRLPAALEWAKLQALSGDLDKARVALEELVELEPENQEAWTILAGILVQAKEWQRLEECERAMSELPKPGFGLLIARANIALSRSDLILARRLLDEALARRPGSVMALETLLRMDVQEGRAELAEQHVERLLSADSGNTFGNHVLGIIQIRHGRLTLAEDSLRRSLAKVRSPEVLNDLAWVLQQRGQLVEAEALAREAVAARPESGALLDTLGVILLRQGKLDEAEPLLRKSTAESPEPSRNVHLADLLARQGKLGDALKLAEDLLDRSSELEREDRELLLDIRRRARAEKR